MARHRLVPLCPTSFAAAFATGRTSSAGFTLIELLIVVAAIATLTSIGVPVYCGMTAGSKIAKAVSDISCSTSRLGCSSSQTADCRSTSMRWAAPR